MRTIYVLRERTVDGERVDLYERRGTAIKHAQDRVRRLADLPPDADPDGFAADDTSWFGSGEFTNWDVMVDEQAINTD